MNETYEKTGVGFFEEQKFAGPWSRAILATEVPWYLLFMLMIVLMWLPNSGWEMIVGYMVLCLVALFIVQSIRQYLKAKLTTQVEAGVLRIIYIQGEKVIQDREIVCNEIVGVKSIAFRAWRAFNWEGHGVHIGWRRDSITLDSDQAIRIELRNGRSLRLGTRRPEELIQSIQAGGAVTA